MPSTRSQSRAEGNEGNAPAQPSQDPHKCIIKPSSSVRSGTSSQKQLKKINAEKRVLDDLAAAKLKILEETYQRKLQLEHEAIDLEDDICSKASYGMDGVADWVDNTMIETKRNLTPPLQPTIPSPPPQPAMHGSSGVSPPEAKPSEIKLDGKASHWLVYKGAYKKDEAQQRG